MRNEHPAKIIFWILCATAAADVGPAERWYGAAKTDFSRRGEFIGQPLRVKARFVRIVGTKGAGGKKGSKAATAFVVAAAGGNIVCEMAAGAEGIKTVRAMKRGTPVVLRGTLSRKSRAFLVREVIQGWGREQLKD